MCGNKLWAYPRLCPILPRAAKLIVVGLLCVLVSLVLMAFGFLLVGCGMTQDSRILSFFV